MTRSGLLSPLLFLLPLLASLDAPAQGSEHAFTPLSQEMLSNPDASDWLMWRGNYENWGYSA